MLEKTANTGAAGLRTNRARAIMVKNKFEIVKVENESDNTAITFNKETGEFEYEESPIFWAIHHFKINDVKVEITSQYDCGDNWCFYWSGGDGDSVEQTFEHYIQPHLLDDTSDDEINSIIDAMTESLENSEPITSISIAECANWIRENIDEDESDIFQKAKQIQDVCGKHKDFCLYLAFVMQDKNYSGDFEIGLQIQHEMTKAQTVTICNILF